MEHCDGFPSLSKNFIQYLKIKFLISHNCETTNNKEGINEMFNFLYDLFDNYEYYEYGSIFIYNILGCKYFKPSILNTNDLDQDELKVYNYVNTTYQNVELKTKIHNSINSNVSRRLIHFFLTVYCKHKRIIYTVDEFGNPSHIRNLSE